MFCKWLPDNRNFKSIYENLVEVLIHQRTQKVATEFKLKIYNTSILFRVWSQRFKLIFVVITYWDHGYRQGEIYVKLVSNFVTLSFHGSLSTFRSAVCLEILSHLNMTKSLIDTMTSSNGTQTENWLHDSYLDMLSDLKTTFISLFIPMTETKLTGQTFGISLILCLWTRLQFSDSRNKKNKS